MTFFSKVCGDYQTFACITKSDRGYPKLLYNGFTYGIKNKLAATTVWQCTRNAKTIEGGEKNKRCSSKINTKIIKGYEMLSVRNPFHNCSSNG